jgi:crotonobetainyl-CoA:carnitine CoA-transferase CaiB-like acyl-CoA transferase
MVAAYMPERWKRLCDALKRQDLSKDARFTSSSDRVLNRSALKRELKLVFRMKDTAEWLAILEAADILRSKVANYADLLRHPQLDFLNLIVGTEHSILGRVFTPGTPINSEEMNSEPFGPVPHKGEHTESILAEYGFGNSEFAEESIRNAVVGGQRIAYDDGKWLDRIEHLRCRGMRA